jgi:hypothetical protein
VQVFVLELTIDQQESEEGQIDLPEDEPAIVKLLIQYLYEGEYDPKLPDNDCMDDVHEIVYTGHRNSSYHYKFPHSCKTSPNSRCTTPYVCAHHRCDIDPCYPGKCVDFVCKHCCPNAVLPPAQGGATQLLLHAKMYEISDKYDVIGLKELAREKFLRATAKFWDDENFAPTAYYAFTTTPEQDQGLRDIVSNIISAHMVLLNKPAVEALLTEFNGLAYGLLKKRAKDLGWI